MTLKRDAIVRLARDGLSNTEIAQELETSRNHVGVVLYHARLRGEVVPKLSRSWVGLSEDERRELVACAERAGVPVNWLARRILTSVVSGGLVAAVLGGDPKEIYDEGA